MSSTQQRRGKAQTKQTPLHLRRMRKPISCLSCRQRKLKCDRALPACGSCVNRGEISTCDYASRQPDRARMSPESKQPPSTTQDRIDHLEQLVLGLIQANRASNQVQVTTPVSNGDVHNAERANLMGGQGSNSTISGDIDMGYESSLGFEASSGTVKTKAGHNQRDSIDTAQWGILLNEISEVRAYLHNQQKEYDMQNKRETRLLRTPHEDPGPSLLLGPARNLNRIQILSQVPSRYVCDNLVKRFFSHLYPAVYILHEQVFYQQYQSFWNDQTGTSIVWVAQLFAILRVAVLDYLREDDEPVEHRGKCGDLAVNFRNNFTDCLVLADHTQPHEFLIEALILHLYGEYIQTRDAQSSLWVLIGSIARLAMRVGYHQATQPLLSQTPFRTEMRRRAWAFIRQFDILISFQVGLPSMIGARLFDNPLPRNIRDDEHFTEDCTALPAQLSDSEPTRISYLIGKAKLAFGFARAVDELDRGDSIPYQRVLEIDRELRQIYDSVPEYYKTGQLSSDDPLVVTSARFVLSSIHHRSLIVTHSRFLEIARRDSTYRYSRNVCLCSAMSILRFQAIQNQEIPVDGRQRSMTNYQTSFAIHDYLLAAAIISIELSSKISAKAPASQGPGLAVPPRAEMIKALSTSAYIFSQMKDKSVEAHKAGDVLGMLVKKFQMEEQAPRPIQRDTRPTEANKLPPSQHVGGSHPSQRPDSTQTGPRTSTTSVGLSPGAHTHLDRTSTGVRQYRSPKTAFLPRDSNTAPFAPGSHVATGRSDLGTSPSWHGAQQHGYYVRPEELTSWEVPDLPELSPTYTAPPGPPMIEGSASEDMAFDFVHPLSYHLAPQTLHNPMSTLWDLSTRMTSTPPA